MKNKILFFLLGTITSLAIVYLSPDNDVSKTVVQNKSELITPTSVQLMSADSFAGNMVIVQGGWKTNVALANSRNSVSINCVREANECILAQADIMDGYFTNNISYYEIQSWDIESGILATSVNSSVCDEQLLQIGPDSVRLYESRKSDAPEAMCPSGDDSSVVLELTNLSNDN